MPADARITGTAAGLHAVLWLPSLRPADEAALAAAARRAGVGIYPVSPLFARPESAMPPRPAGFTLGYASVSVDQIEQGVRLLGDVLADPGWRAAPA